MKTIVLLLTVLVHCQIVCAQDIIKYKSGQQLKVKVIEVRLNDIKFKSLESNDTTTYIIVKSDVQMIKYENGSSEVFQKEPDISTRETVSPAIILADDASTDNWPSNKPKGVKKRDAKKTALYLKGEEDALHNYYNYTSKKGFFFGIAIPFGIVYPLINSQFPPDDDELNYPNKKLFDDPEYRMGYRSKAKKMKNRVLWARYVAGVATTTLVVSIIAIRIALAPTY